MDDRLALLSALPIRSRPGYALSVCLDKMQTIVERAQKSLKPPFLRRLLGGVSKDHARAVVATCNADLSAVMRVTKQIQTSANALGGPKGKAISGYCERLMKTSLEWSNKATDFESNIYGSLKELAECTARLAKVQETLEKPVSQLTE